MVTYETDDREITPGDNVVWFDLPDPVRGTLGGDPNFGTIVSVDAYQARVRLDEHSSSRRRIVSVDVLALNWCDDDDDDELERGSGPNAYPPIIRDAAGRPTDVG